MKQASRRRPKYGNSLLISLIVGLLFVFTMIHVFINKSVIENEPEIIPIDATQEYTEWKPSGDPSLCINHPQLGLPCEFPNKPGVQGIMLCPADGRVPVCQEMPARKLAKQPRKRHASEASHQEARRRLSKIQFSATIEQIIISTCPLPIAI